MPQLFRAMKEDTQGLPELGSSSRGLGIRPGTDVPTLKDYDVVKPGQGGLSVSPNDAMNLPTYRRPVEFKGSGKDPVWMIEEADLGDDLSYREDPSNPRHGFIEPERSMTLADYRYAVENTQPFWQKMTSQP